MRPKSFIFLGDLIDIDGQKSIRLFDDYILKKANKTQIKYIKNHIDSYSNILSFNVNRYEFESKPNGKNKRSFYHLDEKKWNYWVIEHTKVQMDKNIPIILGLSKLDLTVLFEVVYGGIMLTTGKETPGITSRELKTINFFHDNRFYDMVMKKIKNQDKNEIQEIYRLITNFNKERNSYGFIDKALGDFIKLADISVHSPFKILSYFSILELLLTTYKPRTSNDNSLSSQLRKKVNLLNNQFDEKIDIKKYFKGSDSNTIDTIIGKLYQYRNDIAHGNKSDFEKELQILKDEKDNIQSFLRSLLKKVLIYSIKEPQLVKDLKEC